MWAPNTSDTMFEPTMPVVLPYFRTNFPIQDYLEQEKPHLAFKEYLFLGQMTHYMFFVLRRSNHSSKLLTHVLRENNREINIKESLGTAA